MNIFKKMLCFLLVVCLISNGCIMAFAAEDDESTETGSTGGIIVDEDASEDLVMYGDASKQEDGTIELTPLSTWSSGSVWYGRQIDAVSGFTATVDYWAGGGRDDSYGGADGIVMTFAEETGLGSDGEYMGFVTGSYGVELDSYPENSGDPDGKHIAVIYNKVSNHLAYTLDDRVDDSQWHTLEVTYTPGTLTVSLDGEQVLSQDNVTLPDRIYLGISAATGSGKNQHLIRDFIMEGIVSEGGSLVEDNDPIIIIPGIMGSRLFTSSTVFDDSTRVWDPPINLGITQLNEELAYDNMLYVRPCENQNDTTSGTVAEYGREYGAIETYQSLVDGLCTAYTDREVYVFSYDWRKSNSYNAERLAEVINSLGSEKVDLVCHSMGGLVASSYYSQYGSGKVDKIITCGTPYEGAPKLINSVQNWDVLGDGIIFSKNDFSDVVLGIFGGMTKSLKSSFLGVAQLTPTKNYVQEIPMQKDSIWPFSLGDYELTYFEYSEICTEIFGASNFDNATDFQSSILGRNGYNALLSYDNAYFLIGVNHKTITSIKFQLTNNDVDDCLYESDLSYDTKGDGTVPYLSASIMEQVENLNSSHWITKSVDHTETVQDSECIEWVKGILKYGVSKVTSDIVESKPYTVIRIACPVDVTITSGGETLSSAVDTFSAEASFGRLDILGENDDIKMLCIDTSDDYGIVMDGTGNGTMDYAIRFFDENNNQYDERIFEDVPISEDTVIYTDATPDNEITLAIDHDGDGVIDETWTAEEKEWITTDDDDRIQLESIELSAEKQMLEIGETIKVSVVLNPTDSTDKVAVTYSSSDDSVATVDQDGIVIGVTEGTATVTATATNGMEATIDITVSSHIHSWDEGAVTKEPTEDTEGERTYTCGTCGETYTEIIPVLEHTHSYDAVVTAPTCTEQGHTTYICVCGDSYVADYVDALGHSYENGVCIVCGEADPDYVVPHVHSYEAVVTAPTCTEQGCTTYTCECGDSYVDDYVDAHGHNVVQIESTPATCEENGSEYYACEHCGGEEYNVILEATGHDYVDGTCTVCGAEDTDANKGWCSWFDKWFGSWWGDKEEEEKCEHSYNSVITDPTCIDKGYTTHTCEKCGDSYKDSYVDASGHNFVDGVCEYCGAKKNPGGWFDWFFCWFW